LKVFGTTASTSTTTGALQVAGGVGVAGALFTGGNVTVNGGTVGTAASTNLTLAGGSSGASLVLGNGSIAGAIIATPGVGFFAFNKSEDSPVPSLARFLNPGATTAGRYNEIIFGKDLNAGGAGTIGYKSDTGTPANGRLFLVNYGTNQDTFGLQITRGGNTLIGGTTDITGSGGLKVFGTTASTSTTTGALQVAGGVGVAGSLFVGGSATLSVAGNPILTLESTATADAASYVRYVRSSTGTARTWWTGVGIFSNDRWGIYDQTRGAMTLDIDSAGDVRVVATTASTSTTTGALKVAGGVGVAGAAFFGGAIAIGNTVNTVTATLPNRTITMVIGGTTYYIHAKTTND
jgi:hypothetical protein